MNWKQYKELVAGIVFILILSAGAFALSETSLVKPLKLSPLILGILLGMLYANTLRHKQPASWSAGIGFSSKHILRCGIVLYGFQISLADVMAVGFESLLIDCIVVISTLALGICIGKLMRMDEQTALLCSVGSSICGAAAVLGAEPIVGGKAYKTAVAVSTVVIFGTIAMFLYPALYRAGIFAMDAHQLGVYTGATLHEVAHVYGAGEAMNTAGPLLEELQASQADIQREAVIVKMIRVMMLAPVLLMLSLMLRKKGDASQQSKGKLILPLFPFLFIAVIAFNSLGLLPESLVLHLRLIATFMLTMAMTALGVNTTVSQFKQAGLKPFILALILFIWLSVGGYALVKLLA